MSLEDKLKSMTPVQALVIGLGLMGVYYLAVFNSGASIQSASDKVRSEINQKKAELVRANQLIGENQAITQEEQLKEASLAELVRIAPGGLTGSELMRIISNEIKASGANLVRLVDSSATNTGQKSEKFVLEVPVQIEIEGTFSQILVFLSYLTRVDRLLLMKDYRLEAKVEGTKLKNLKLTADFSGFKTNDETPEGPNAKN